LIVVDASAVIEFLFATQLAGPVGDRIVDPREEVGSPCLLDAEVAHVIRRWHFAGTVDEPRARRAIDHLARLRVLRWPHEPLLPRIWALRHNFTAYDAAYIALAESLGATLLTCDRALARNDGLDCTVELIE